MGYPRIRGVGYVIEDRGYATPCWIWRHARNNQGYAVRTEGGKTFLVHRREYENNVGEIPDGMELDHLCKQGKHGCVNFHHCEPVTHTTNVRRGERSKLTEALVHEASQRVMAGETQTAVARDMGVHSSVISEAIRGVIWKGVVPIWAAGGA